MRKVDASEIRITNDVTQNVVMGIIFILAGLGLLFFVAIPDKSWGFAAGAVALALPGVYGLYVAFSPSTLFAANQSGVLFGKLHVSWEHVLKIECTEMRDILGGHRTKPHYVPAVRVYFDETVSQEPQPVEDEKKGWTNSRAVAEKQLQRPSHEVVDILNKMKEKYT